VVFIRLLAGLGRARGKDWSRPSALPIASVRLVELQNSFFGFDRLQPQPALVEKNFVIMMNHVIKDMINRTARIDLLTILPLASSAPRPYGFSTTVSLH